jgi:uncharacterized protein (TIGR03086 family)
VIDVLAAVAEPNRRRLLELLRGGEQTVTELAAQFRVTRPAISQHLGILAEAGLVEVRRQGRYRYYRLNSTGMSTLQAALNVFWTSELEQLAEPNPKGSTMPIEKSVLVPLDADQTFALLTQPERLRRWQGITARVDLRAGGEYRWTIIPGNNAGGTFTEVEPGRRVVFTWAWEGPDGLPPDSSTVTITLEPTEGGTTVRLVHEGLSDEEGAGHLQGWIHYLDRLVTAAQLGDAGPDDWMADSVTLDPLSAAESSLALCQRVLRDLPPGAGELSTPCAKYTMHDLVVHLTGSIVSLGGAAGATITAQEGTAPEVIIADAAQAALEAWRRRGLEGTVALGSGEMPAELAAGILTMELLVHAWDFAQALGRTIPTDDALADYALALARGLIAPAMRDGDNFADEVLVGPDADAISRLVAFTGRSA